MKRINCGRLQRKRYHKITKLKNNMKKTKIICTIGPSSKDKETLEKLILAGMDIIRINTSHSNHKEVLEIIDSARKISKKHNKNIAIMLDLQGPKIRVGKLEREIILQSGQNVFFTINDDYASKIHNGGEILGVTYDNFIEDIESDNTIFIDDGLIECRVVEVNKKEGIAKCRVIKGGPVSSFKGINLPKVSVSADSVTPRDLEFLNLGISLKVDFIAQSFVRSRKDIEKIRQIIKDKGSNIMIIAKIEKSEAVNDFDDILKCSDAVMVARGDLGVEVNAEDVPSIQKEIIIKCNNAGKPVITATQMLDSMMRNPRPTRAEVSDVANAILDGSDAVMLSGETAVGKYPVESLEMMVRIVRKTEEVLDYSAITNKEPEISEKTITEAISFASCDIANVLGAKAIVSSTQSGHTARQVSRNRPKSIIIGASPHDWVVKQLLLSWGVIPIKTRFTENINKMIEEAVRASLNSGFVKKGDKIVITGGVMVNKPGSTNFINVRRAE